MVFKIKQNIDACIGCGACVAICPENWEFDNGKAKPKKTELSEIGCNKSAADACPVKCIEIIEEE
jgi:ferredoxin